MVGYDTLTSQSGFNWIAPEFLTVGGNTVNIQDIQISGEVDVNGGDNIQFLDEGGSTTISYPWLLTADTDAAKDGWFDEDAWALADVEIPAGDSVLVNTVNAGVSIGLVGEVSDSDYEKTSVAGFNWSGNVTPSALNIQDIQISGDVDVNGGDNIQFLDAGGSTIVSYPWLLTADTDAAKDGWFDEDAWALADVTIAAGEGVLVNTVNSDVKIAVASAL